MIHVYSVKMRGTIDPLRYAAPSLLAVTNQLSMRGLESKVEAIAVEAWPHGVTLLDSRGDLYPLRNLQATP